MNTYAPGTPVIWYMATHHNWGNGITLIQPTPAMVLGTEDNRVLIKITRPDGPYYRRVLPNTLREAA